MPRRFRPRPATNRLLRPSWRLWAWILPSSRRCNSSRSTPCPCRETPTGNWLDLTHEPVVTDMEVAAAPAEARGKEGAAPDPADQQVACREQPQIGEQGAFVPEPMHEMQGQAGHDGHLEEWQGDCRKIGFR